MYYRGLLLIAAVLVVALHSVQGLSSTRERSPIRRSPTKDRRPSSGTRERPSSPTYEVASPKFENYGPDQAFDDGMDALKELKGHLQRQLGHLRKFGKQNSQLERYIQEQDSQLERYIQEQDSLWELYAKFLIGGKGLALTEADGEQLEAIVERYIREQNILREIWDIDQFLIPIKRQGDKIRGKGLAIAAEVQPMIQEIEELQLQRLSWKVASNEGYLQRLLAYVLKAIVNERNEDEHLQRLRRVIKAKLKDMAEYKKFEKKNDLALRKQIEKSCQQPYHNLCRKYGMPYDV